ncbi:MAG: HEAT repeat domain-containing protein [candidate division Zixibacteria bacterium]|nr:HEAT repeat domain-containing protein [candidate division Zixibacteria bacterium]
MKLMNLIKLNLIILLLIFSTVTADMLTDKIDSLFIYASSGEIQYQDLVQPAIDSIAIIGVEAVPHLINKFSTKSARERLTIINILKKIGVPAVPYLTTALNRPEDIVVARICWSLGSIADSSALESLINVATHKSWWVREKAADALGKIKSMQASSVIINMLNDDIGQVRKAAVVASGRIKINDAIPSLVHALGDSFYGARMSAVEVLVLLDTALVLQTIQDSITSTNEILLNNACYLLGEIGSDDALDILSYFLESKNRIIRAQATTAIIKSDPEDKCGYFHIFISDETDYFINIQIESALKASKNILP